MSRKPRSTPQTIPFDEAMAEVERIIERIESGQIGLEESLAQYERGAALIRSCREALTRAEQRVRDLTAQMHADTVPKSEPPPPAEGREPPSERSEPAADDSADEDPPF